MIARAAAAIAQYELFFSPALMALGAFFGGDFK